MALLERTVAEPRTYPSGAPRRVDRADGWAVGILVVLPLLSFVGPALFGHAVLPGDDLTQNLPLRVLVGSDLRHGDAPLLNPFIWSGAPLLGGWNAGAAYPFTALFAVLPATAAWTVNLVLTWWVAGLGLFALLRALRLNAVASFLGAFSFAFGGSMIAQVPHFGLVAGESWIPLQVLAVWRLSQPISARRRMAWIAVLGATFAMTILAGEPRAIDTAVIVVGIYALWRALRLGRKAGAYVASAIGGGALGFAIGAVQWLPGALAVASSQRSAHSFVLYSSGSIPIRWLSLLVLPNLLGGTGSFGMPPFFASYNLTEVTGYVGIVPVVAAFALLGRVRTRPRLPEWIVWYVVAAVGVVLSLGSNTPLGHVLVRVPLFGSQRLQSRNLVIVDFALAVLLAYFADDWLRRRSERTSRRRRSFWHNHLDTALGAMAAGVLVAIAIVGIAWGSGLARWLGVTGPLVRQGDSLRPWLVPSLVLGLATLALVLWGTRLSRSARARMLVGLVAVDLVFFTLTSVLAVGDSLDQAAPPAPQAPSAEQASSALSKTTVPVASLADGGRFVVYDPDLIDTAALTRLGVPDSNVTSGSYSAQGYSSIVDGPYAAATGSHQATGDGQNALSPAALENGTFDDLETRVLLTPPSYLVGPPGVPTSIGPQGPAASIAAGRRDVAAGHEASWMLGQPLSVSSVSLSLAQGSAPAPGAVRVGFVSPDGALSWPTATETLLSSGNGASVRVTLARPMLVAAVVALAAHQPMVIGPPTVATNAGTVVADGDLQAGLMWPHWTYAGMDGPFAVFRDLHAKPALTLRSLPHGSLVGASVRAVAGSKVMPEAAEVSSPHGVEVVRSVAAIPGWRATWQPAGGAAATTLPVKRLGVVQVVEIPPGRGVLSWRYRPAGVTWGVVLSALGIGLTLALLAMALAARRRARRFAHTGGSPQGSTMMSPTSLSGRRPRQRG